MIDDSVIRSEPMSRRALLVATLTVGALTGCRAPEQGRPAPRPGGAHAGPRADTTGASRVALAPAAGSHDRRPQPPPPTPSRAAVVAWAATSDWGAVDRGALLVLCYHDVAADPRAGGKRPSRFTVTPQQLSDHLALLSAAQFHAATLDDVVAARRGLRPLPPRSVLITFDDAAGGQWTWADRLLAAHGLRATAFVITGRVGRPGYLRWSEVAAMSASGRWDIGDHTHALHQRVPVGSRRDQGSMLINRLPDGTGRLETRAAARRRVAADLKTSFVAMTTHGLPRPRAFAYPYSQVDHPTDDPTFARWVRGYLGTTFDLVATNVAGRVAGPSDLRSGLLPRLEVQHDTSTGDLVRQVRQASPGH